MITKFKQNEMSQRFSEGSDLHQRENEVLQNACKKLKFTPIKLLSRSSWWTSKEIGAFHYLGTYQGKKSILKIQGIKPTVSEIDMINLFRKNNKSKLIRPPYLYAFISWDNEERYEALVLEVSGNRKVINSPTTENEVHEFFEIYKEYKKNCVNNPWIEKPRKSLSNSIKDNFRAWRKASFKLYPTHPLRLNSDKDLVDRTIEILSKNYQNTEPQFMHGHFSAIDLRKVGGQIVLLSNLYWSYRNPFRDAVFAYHWFMYALADVKNINIDKIDNQRKLWLDKINQLPKNENEKRLLSLALLERATAGLNLDALSTDPDSEVSRYLVETTRKEVEKLIKLFPRK